jgi:glycerol-3-phosphate dehydrogenase
MKAGFQGESLRNIVLAPSQQTLGSMVGGTLTTARQIDAQLILKRLKHYPVFNNVIQREQIPPIQCVL